MLPGANPSQTSRAAPEAGSHRVTEPSAAPASSRAPVRAERDGGDHAPDAGQHVALAPAGGLPDQHLTAEAALGDQARRPGSPRGCAGCDRRRARPAGCGLATSQTAISVAPAT